MRLFTNTKLIERQARIARYATFGGLAVLVGSLLLSFTSENILLAYVTLSVGFILAYIGSALANKYIREPRADHALEKALKGFDNKHQLYNFLLPAPHVLLTPNGLIVFKVKPNEGRVMLEGEKWREPFRLSRVFGGMGREPLANPGAQLRAEIARLKKFLATKMSNAALVPIDGYVIFTDPKVQLELNGARVQVARADDLKDTLRKIKRGAPLKPELIAELEKILGEFVG
ncbi:MAG: NERD domain-containing protein [Chloroflexi bacterium]|nr:NERD domain-containing protein [Chloroflexota bacterium]MBI3741100.1 NERD domain-containing protein [Chloroflexota bacterium]